MPDPPPLPEGFVLPPILNQENFKIALFEYAGMPGSRPPVDTMALPCTIAQCCNSAVRLVRLEVDPWIQHIVAQGDADIVLPIAFVYVPRPRTNMLDAAKPRPFGGV